MLSIRVLAAAITLVGFGLVGGACGGDGGGDALTLEEYFERVDELENKQLADSQAIDDELDLLDEDLTVDEVADSFQEQIDVLRELRDGLDDLNPPDEAQDAHDEVVDSLEASADEFEDLLDEFRDEDSVEDAFAAVGEADTPESDRATEACIDLQQVAADNGIDVELDCEEE